MTDSTTTFTILGTRGSRPAFGSQFLKIGGHTTCFALDMPKGLIVIDAGSGILPLNEWCRTANNNKPVAILFSHYHLDHILGLAAFQPLYEPDREMHLYGADPYRDKDWHTVLANFISEPYWPVPLTNMPALHHHDLNLDAGSVSVFGIQISYHVIPHTQQCLAFRIHLPGRSIVIATDHEPREDTRSQFIEFCRDADVLIHDAQLTPDELPERIGWGHSTWEQAAQIARASSAKRLLLTHHDPDRTDDQVANIVSAAQSIFPNTRAASEGLRFQYLADDNRLETAVRPD